MDSPCATLPSRWPASAWLASACVRAEQRFADHRHGDLPRWRAALDALPRVATSAALDRDAPELGEPAPDGSSLRAALLELHPWRKGPLRLGGVTIDSEWRSDWKWRRLAPHVDWRGQRILDIGCGNGYYGLRMLGAGARLVVGVDGGHTEKDAVDIEALEGLARQLADFVLASEAGTGAGVAFTQTLHDALQMLHRTGVYLFRQTSAIIQRFGSTKMGRIAHKFRR